MQVIQFPVREEVTYIDSKPFQKPKYGYQYILMCKEILDIQDYEEILLAIMDEDYYQGADQEIRHIVDVYFNYEN
jgi:hypothetical protein